MMILTQVHLMNPKMSQIVMPDSDESDSESNN